MSITFQDVLQTQTSDGEHNKFSDALHPGEESILKTSVLAVAAEILTQTAMLLLNHLYASLQILL